ncbi:MAG: sulfatase-like hydrolase/transferase [Candidatus Latescibacterota bacterium]|nr:MAG: sulfatase-like hydrolase/transferase [Candidatus Latescibacterota bacterium]
MSSRYRFNIILFLGLLFWALILHSLFSSRLRIVIQDESFASLLNYLPTNPVIIGGVLILGVFAFLGIVFFINRRVLVEPRRRVSMRNRIIVAILGIAMLLVGCLMVWIYPRAPRPQELSGLIAVVVGASLLFFTFITSKRAIIVSHVILLVAVVVAAALPQIIPGHRKKVGEIRESIEMVMSELDRRPEEWKMLDPLDIVDAANARAKLNSIYRFDEHLKDIKTLEAPKIDFVEGVLFDLPRDGKFVATESEELTYEISEGSQIFPNYRAETLLRTEQPLGLDASAVGSLVITLKVSSGSYFQVFWGQEEDIDRHHHGIRIPLAPSGQSASYEIKERIIGYRGKERIDHFWIIPSDRDARVEIESFRVLDRTNAVLGGVPFDVGYENVDDDIRPVLFVATPSRITYSVSVPRERPRLLFGLATSDTNIPITFEIVVGHDGSEQSVFSEVLANESRWSDHEVDLAPWAGNEIDVSFKTSSEKRSLGLWCNPVLLGERARDPNVVIFLVDALRPDHLGAYGYTRDTSPVFDSLSTKGTLFDRAYSNGTTTKHSVPSLFSSNPISATGVRHVGDVLPKEFPTMAEILRLMGYTTAAFTTNPNAGPYSGTHQGFSRLFTASRIAREGGSDVTPPDAEFLIGDLMQSWIRENADRNFFLYIHTMDAHGPYDPPEPYRHYFEAATPGTPESWHEGLDPPWLSSPTSETRTALYDGEIEYGDFHMGRFVKMLDESGVLENTILIVTADHGEYFGEHGMWEHRPPPFVQGTHIPLLIIGPGFPSGVRVAEKVQILDILPTVLDAVDLEPDPLLFQGRSLLPLAKGESAETFRDRVVFIEGDRFGELGIHCGDYHLIPEKNLIFDLTNDPDESRYLNEFVLDFRLKFLSRRLAKRYLQTYASLHDIVAPTGGEALGVDRETLKQLRSLGYIE